jgi:hypothetical protein
MAGRVARLLVAACFAPLFSGCVAPPGATSAVDLAPRVIEARARDVLLGRAPEELSRVLGKPLLIRHEPSSAYVRFLADACVLDVFLHETDSPRGLLVRYIEVRPATPRDPDACRRLEARLRRAGEVAEIKRA